MFPGDSKSEWPAGLLSDSRVIHWWDDGKLVGSWYAQQSDYRKYGRVLWDAFLVYAPDARWDQVPSNLISLGRTIVEKREDLRKSLQPYLKQ
jgi:hypothetical protein